MNTSSDSGPSKTTLVAAGVGLLVAAAVLTVGVWLMADTNSGAADGPAGQAGPSDAATLSDTPVFDSSGPVGSEPPSEPVADDAEDIVTEEPPERPDPNLTLVFDDTDGNGVISEGDQFVFDLLADEAVEMLPRGATFSVQRQVGDSEYELALVSVDCTRNAECEQTGDSELTVVLSQDLTEDSDEFTVGESHVVDLAVWSAEGGVFAQEGWLPVE